jgi:hypothetical protein
MAERTGAAVVLVRHLNKTPGGNVLYRGGGSIGIIGAARSGLVVGRHPRRRGPPCPGRQKNNLSLPPESLAYAIETAENGAAASPTWASRSDRRSDTAGSGRWRGKVRPQ